MYTYMHTLLVCFFSCSWFRTNNTQNYTFAAKFCVHFVVNARVSHLRCSWCEPYLWGVGCVRDMMIFLPHLSHTITLQKDRFLYQHVILKHWLLTLIPKLNRVLWCVIELLENSLTRPVGCFYYILYIFYCHTRHSSLHCCCSSGKHRCVYSCFVQA